MILQFNKNLVKVLSVFATSPGSSLQRNKIQEFTGINNIILDKILARLLNSNILKKEKRFYFLNLSNKNSKIVLDEVANYYHKAKDLPLKVYSLLIDIIFEMSEIRYLNELYLFGSYSKLVYTEDSDIDFAIISERVNKKEVNEIIRKIQKRYNKKIEVHYFKKDFYKNKKDPLVKEILRDGVRLI
ncbi:MAG: nucleotidyltransferase domain-containing protein [Nanoarchaeota archaeon]